MTDKIGPQLSSAMPGFVSKEPAPPGTGDSPLLNSPQLQKEGTSTLNIQASNKGIEQAKKRLRAFSIQKKLPNKSPLLPSKSGGVVVIGKLSGTKPVVKTSKAQDTDPETKKVPKPPKPGCLNKTFQETYNEVQKKTLAEIEGMKWKMELADLGIPLGLVCPPPNSDQAMPTKAMPPIKTFLGPKQIEEIIRDAKKAKAEGKEYKFDYKKILPDYDNPFQTKKEENRQEEQGEHVEHMKSHRYENKYRYSKNDSYRDAKRSEKRHLEFHEPFRKYNDIKNENSKDKHKEKVKHFEINVDKESRKKVKGVKEADVNLNDYLVCDSWSLDTEDKIEICSPKTETQPKRKDDIIVDQIEQLKQNLQRDNKKDTNKKEIKVKSSSKKEEKPLNRIVRLQPVIDTFKFEIDDDPLDVFDDSPDIESYSKPSSKKTSHEGSPLRMKSFYDHNDSVDVSQSSFTEEYNQKYNDDSFLESVIKDIKVENMSDKEKGFLVEYDLSPDKLDNWGYGTPEKPSKASKGRDPVTPELDDSYHDLYSGRRSGYSTAESGFRSSESGHKPTKGGCRSTESDLNSMESSYRSTDSGYRINDSFAAAECVIKESPPDYDMDKMPKATMDSLESWSFVLKICQPLLFRHDRNKCYRETKVHPSLWYTENPKGCSCVKDRYIVYKELETCKMGLVDRVYGCDQILDSPFPRQRTWYPKQNFCLTDVPFIQLSTNWETDDSSQNSEIPVIKAPIKEIKKPTSIKENQGNTTPKFHSDEMLDMEYQRFMDIVDVKKENRENSRSNTPTKTEGKKETKPELAERRREVEVVKLEEKRNIKKEKIKEDAEGWSQESEVEESEEKSTKKSKLEKKKNRKRKHSSTSSMSDKSDSDSSGKAKKRIGKKKKIKKNNSKLGKRLAKRRAKKLKDKRKRRAKKLRNSEKSTDMSEDDDVTEKAKSKERKKNQDKTKTKKKRKRKSSSSESSSSSGSSTTESEKENTKLKKKLKKKEEQLERMRKKKKKHRKSSDSDSESDDVFDVNILKNIKTERLTDDENCYKMQDFSPRRQPMQRQEIINVKELQNNLVAIKQEVVAEQEFKHSPDLDEKPQPVPPVSEDMFADNEKDSDPLPVDVVKDDVAKDECRETRFKEPFYTQSNTKPISTIEESNLSQASSQESICSVKETYEKDNSHLRPSSQNSNYSFNDVIKNKNQYYHSQVEDDPIADHSESEKYNDDANEYEYRQNYDGFDGSYEYSDNQGLEPSGNRRIETVVSVASARGEIKCDWRAGRDGPRHAIKRPSRWGLKPGDANIVLTGDTETSESELVYPIRSVLDEQPPPPPTTYRIQTISSTRHRDDNMSPATGYDEAYAAMYAASDRLQYGDCFSDGSGLEPEGGSASNNKRLSLDDRIDRVLRDTAQKVVNKEEVNTEDSKKEKGILLFKEKEVPVRVNKRVSFADGYKPGQDSDVEQPPKKRPRYVRTGCAWPCPTAHPDHVPLWDALPPPPPPPGSPPPPAPPPPPVQQDPRRYMCDLVSLAGIRQREMPAFLTSH